MKKIIVVVVAILFVCISNVSAQQEHLTLKGTGLGINANPLLLFNDSGNNRIGWLGYGSKNSPHFFLANEQPNGHIIMQNTVDVTGNLGIGTTTPSHKLDVNGNISTTGTIYQKSNTGLRISNLDNKLIFWATDNATELHSAGLGGIVFKNNSNSANMTINNNGNVGIGTITTNGYKLAVNGTIGAREIVVNTDSWSDFVFNSDYRLMPLAEVESFIQENNHLPDVPSETEVKEKGINVAEMNAKLLQKIEELTLYVIEISKENKELKRENQKQQKQIEQLLNK